jgi:RHS repeat-associated protein
MAHPAGRSGQGHSSGESRPAGPSGAASAPALTVPKGGGAIRGIGEKFGANPATGTASVSIPIATSPGRSGFGPQLSLSYDSGAGNGPFGFGWALSLPAITRKTDKGLPRYEEGGAADAFVLSGAEDLVPVPTPTGVADAPGFKIQRYRPRIEGLFARIERWTELTTSDVHWRTITRDNITTLFGRDNDSRIFDPADLDPRHPRRVFSWLICQSHDDKGNAIVYRYQPEDSTGVDQTLSHEHNRSAAMRGANRYLKRVLYGNTSSMLDDADLSDTGWLFEVVLDYGEAHVEEQPPGSDGDARVRARGAPNRDWLVRPDPFSSYRAGFEVRTYRLCRRVLMFHHFPAELGTDDYLVRSTDLTYNETATGSFLTQVTQCGYAASWPAGGSSTAIYVLRSLPPLEFEYSKATIQERVEEATAETLENLPQALEGRFHQWVDLNGEGLSGLLTEQAGAWYYKTNEGGGRLGALQPVVPAPSLANLAGGRQQLLDLTGDGALNLASFDGSTAGFYERTTAGGWDTFRTFAALPRLDWDSENLRFVDLTGDGFPDVLITEDAALRWHPSLGEEGFGTAARTPPPLDEDRGPRLVFADGTQSIYLADLSGDGLTDLVRIRNGEVCYWPNVGYGRFGAKVTMDGAPWFDHPDLFDQGRVRLADIDGSGTTDILYVETERIGVYRNLCGNAWQTPEYLTAFPPIHDLSTAVAVDLLGNGTACLVWSSGLPGDARRSLRYVDLMGGQKPHLLVAAINNLGAETRVRYAPSTRFYLADRRAGRPWVTRLPFPVHVVERVDSLDLVSGNRFVTRYAYHHGHFDGVEREFRGFGMVQQWDTEEFSALAETQAVADATNLDAASHVPPLLINTWFHTGAFTDGHDISRQYEREYWTEPSLTAAAAAGMRLPDTLLPTDRRVAGGRAPYTLSDGEMREACRALKGNVLRQETYAIDGSERQNRPYSVSERSYTIELLQPTGTNQHAIFFTHPREAIEFHYERTTFTTAGLERFDPRVSHSLTLDVDDFGNSLRSASVAYGRRLSDADLETLFANGGLTGVAKPVDREVQRRRLVSFTENRFTNPTDGAQGYRAPLPCESRSYQLFGATPAATLAGGTNLFTLAELRQRIEQASDGDHDLSYEDFAGTGAADPAPWRRPIGHSRVLYRSDNLVGPADGLLPLGMAEPLALPGETYTLAFPAGMLSAIFQRDGQPLIPNEAPLLAAEGGYVRSQQHKALQLFPAADPDGQWWTPAGRLFYSDVPAVELATARQHFFLPRRFRNAWGASSNVRYDSYDLLLLETVDALLNRVTAGERSVDDEITRECNDYRVLAPFLVMQPNRNRSEVAFDALGMVTALAVMGKPEETLGDRMTGIVRDLGPLALEDLIADPRAAAPAAVRDAGARVVFDLHRFHRTRLANPGDSSRWQPPLAVTISRETHASDPSPPGGVKFQINVSYSDGFGREIQQRIQAEPGPLMPGGATIDPRWVVSGWAIFNNKGKPVRRYEPFFEDTLVFRGGRTAGVTSIVFYDPAERIVGTLHPNHSWEKVAFDPWSHAAWDVNDTAGISDPGQDPHIGAFFRRLDADEYLPTWTSLRTNSAAALAAWPGTDPLAVRRRTLEREAAEKTLVHAGTATVTYLDPLGRPSLTLAHNRHTSPADDERHPARTSLDLEGNQREVRDSEHDPADPLDLGRLVLVYDYDLAGNAIHQASFESGERWTLVDVGRNPIRHWDTRGHTVETGYDDLRRPTTVHVSGGTVVPAGRRVLAERTVYGEAQGTALNHRGKVYEVFDAAGCVTHDRYDFKGGLERSRRRLLADYSSQVDWDLDPVLLSEEFSTYTRADALGRPVQSMPPHSRAAGIAVIQTTYNGAGLLERLDLWREQAAEPIALLATSTATDAIVTNVEYNAKGQRTRVEHGNGVITTFVYEPTTFRLLRTVTRRPGGAFATDCPNPPTPLELPTRPCGVQNLQFAFDPAGNVTGVYDDAQQTIYYNGTVAPPSSRYRYDALYRLIEASGREHASNAMADLPANRPAWKPHYDFNDWTRRGLPRPGDGQAMVPYVEQYTYDKVGNLEQFAHQVQGGTAARWVRRYDCREPSLLETGKMSNRLTATSLPGDPPAGPYSARYQHDAHGNLTSMPHLAVLEWDYRDQLHSTRQQVIAAAAAAPGTARKTWYVYSGAGQRIRKVTERSPGSPVDERIYVGGFEIYREYEAGAVVLERETLHVDDTAQRVALVETKTREAGAVPATLQALTRYQYSNHLGTVALELDAQAEIISYEEYYPHGGTSHQAGRSVTEVRQKRFRYTGKERDEESGFYYHGARYYAPWLGRWTSCDRGVPGEGLNSYCYVRNNPVAFRDGDGNNAIPGTPEQHRLYVKIVEDMRKQGPVVLNAGSMIPEEDSTPVLMALPDGTGWAGPRSKGERIKQQMAREMAIERTLKTGANIAGGLGGALGYMAGGDKGSDVGALIDTGLSIAPGAARSIKDRIQKARPPAPKPKKDPDKKEEVEKPGEAEKKEPHHEDRYDPETALGRQQANLDYNSREGASFEAFAMDHIREGAKQTYGEMYMEQEYLGGYFGRGAIPDALVWSRDIPGEMNIIVDAKSGGLKDAQTRVFIDYLAIRGPDSPNGVIVFLIPEGRTPPLSNAIKEYLADKRVDLVFQEVPGWTPEYLRNKKQ